MKKMKWSNDYNKPVHISERGSYSKIELDEICKHLSDEWINPHRSMLGLGNYDINVIMTALQKKGCAAVWFDKRKWDHGSLGRWKMYSMRQFLEFYREPSTIDTSQILGFILNVPTDYKIGFVVLPLKRRHWIAIRKIDEQYWNLDSKLDAPQSIGNVRKIVCHNDCTVYLISICFSSHIYRKTV